jgi:hypothetical protein
MSSNMIQDNNHLEDVITTQIEVFKIFLMDQKYEYFFKGTFIEIFFTHDKNFF